MIVAAGVVLYVIPVHQCILWVDGFTTPQYLCRGAGSCLGSSREIVVELTMCWLLYLTVRAR